MPLRNSKHAQPQPHGSFWGFHLVKTAVSFSISRKILTQHFDQNIKPLLRYHEPFNLTEW